MTIDELREYRRYALQRALICRAMARDKSIDPKDWLFTPAERCRGWRKIARKWRLTQPGPDPPRSTAPYMTAEYWQQYDARGSQARWRRRYGNLDGWLAAFEAARERGGPLNWSPPPINGKAGKGPDELPKTERVKRVRAYMAKYNVSMADLTGLSTGNGNGHTEKQPLITAQRPKPLQAPSCKQGAERQPSTTGQETQAPAARTVWRKIGGRMYQVPLT